MRGYLDGKWSTFMIEAEVDQFGEGRIVKVHNETLDQLAALRQRVEELETELARPKHEVLRQLADAVERYGLMKQRAEAAEAKLERVVEVLLANRDSADRCLNEPNHPAWVHAQAHATISVCDTVLAAAKGEE